MPTNRDLDNLKLHVDSIKIYTDAKLSGIEKAIDIARAELEKRLEGMNEFRLSLKEQQANFIYRTEFADRREQVDADIRTLREKQAIAEGKASMLSVVACGIVSVIALVASIAGIILDLVK